MKLIMVNISDKIYFGAQKSGLITGLDKQKS